MSEYHIELTNAAAERHAADDLTPAERGYRLALSHFPEYVPALMNLGYLCADTGRLAEGIDFLTRAVHLEPNNAAAHLNLGFALELAGSYDEQLACCARAAELAPQSASARFNHARALLLNGDFERGWDEFEYRWELEPLASGKRNLVQPLWAGEDISGRTILLHAEQGYGDTLQFMRYVPLIAALGATVILAVQPRLVRLLRSLAGVARLIPDDGVPIPDFDVHCPLLSLPRAFRTRLESTPARVPYLAADAQDLAFWASCTAYTRDMRVGLVWSGNPAKFDRRLARTNLRRSIALAELLPLAGIPGIQYYSLQKGEHAEDALHPPEGMNLIDLTDAIRDFGDTAALIENLDLVVTVDTAVAHLAGALGKPVWVLSRVDGCWRWLRARGDSPWYPTLRLYRQRELNRWGAVIDEVARDLRALMQARRPGSPHR